MKLYENAGGGSAEGAQSSRLAAMSMSRTFAVLCVAGSTALASAPVAADPPATCTSDFAVSVKAGAVLLALVDDPADAAALLDNRTIAGIAPFGTLTSAEASRIEPGTLLASDEEGGRVQRFRDLAGALPSAATQAATLSPAEVTELYENYGAALDAYGVRIAFAPVVDVGGGPAIGDRSYGEDPAVVTAYGGAAAEGYRNAGIIPVLKHFPGHGRASADTHNGAAITPPLDDLRTSDLIPFAELAHTDVAIMVGHLDVPGLTNGRPASMSENAITGLLRVELGFDGLVISDALGMGAIRQFTSPSVAAVSFLRSGGDLAIIDLDDSAAVRDAIVDAVESGLLDETRLDEAVERIDIALGRGVPCGRTERPVRDWSLLAERIAAAMTQFA